MEAYQKPRLEIVLFSKEDLCTQSSVPGLDTEHPDMETNPVDLLVIH